MPKLKSVEQANDLARLMQDGCEWSHELAKQYLKRIKSLKYASDRQQERFYNAKDCFERADAANKGLLIDKAERELIFQYRVVFDRFKSIKLIK